MNFLLKHSKIHYSWWIMISCIFILAGNIGILQNCLGVFMVPVSKALNIPVTKYALAITINSLVLGLGTPLAGKIIDKFDVRRILIISVTVECFAYFCNSFWSSIVGWYVTSIIIGFCQCFISFLIVPHLMNTWFVKRTGLALGIACCGTSIGSGIFQAVAGSLISSLGYQISYQILALVAWLLSGPLAFAIIRSKPEDIGIKAYGADEIESSSDTSFESSGFTISEAKKMPIYYLLMLTIVLLTMGISFNMQLTTFIMSKGNSLVIASTVSGISISVGGVLGNLLSGGLNDKYGVRVGIVTSVIIGCVGLLLCISGIGGVAGLFVGVGMFGFIQTMIDISGSLLTRGIFGTIDFDRVYSYICFWIPLTTAFSAYIYSFIYQKTGTYDSAVWLALACSLAAALLVYLICKYAGKHYSKGRSGVNM